MLRFQSDTRFIKPLTGAVSIAMLIMFAMTNSVSAAEEATSQTASEDQVKSVVDSEAAGEQMTADQKTTATQGDEARYSVDRYPHWPERKYERREMVPPPPPGPYMSTALSDDYSVNGPTFSSQRTIDGEPRFAPMPSGPPDMSVFSPDRKWPKLRPDDDDWKPKGGYQYAPLHDAKRFTRHLPPRPYPENYNYSGDKWMPSMSFGSGRSVYRSPGPYGYPGRPQPYQNR